MQLSREQQQAIAMAKARKRRQVKQVDYSDASDLLEPSAPPQTPEPKRYQERISIPGAAYGRDYLTDLTQQNFTPSPIADGIIRAGIGIGAGLSDLAARPVEKTKKGIVHGITSPQRFAAHFNDAIRDAKQGNIEGAGRNAIQSVTAGLEAATLAAPSGVITKQAAKPKVVTPLKERAFDQIGVDKSIAALTDDEGTKRLAQSISENAIAGAGVRRNTKRQLTQVESAQTRIADEFGAVDPREAGRIVLDGAEFFDARANKLYKAAFRDIDETASTIPEATVSRITQNLERFDSAELAGMFEPSMASRLREATQRPLSIRDMRSLRTEVRQAQNKYKVDKNRDDQFLGSLEGALTEDIYRAVEQTAGPRALARMKAADRYHAKTKQTVATVLRPFLRRGATEESAYRGIVSAMQGQTTKAGRGDLKALRAIRSSLGQDQWKEVAGSVLKAAGRQKEGDDFSLAVLTTNWKNWGETQKNIMFGGSQTKLRKDVDALMSVADRLQSVERMSNFSNSGVSLQNIATLGGATIDPVSTGVILLGQAQVGRLLTNPQYVKSTRIALNSDLRAAQLQQMGRSAEAQAIKQRGRAQALAAIVVIENSDETLSGQLEELKYSLSNDNFTQRATQATK